MASDSPAISHPLRVADLTTRKPTRFDLVPDEAALERIAPAIGALAVSQVRFRGDLRPQGRRDWTLNATLEAEITQPCIVSLEPVTSAIREDVVRRYIADMPEPEGDEVEMPEDDTAEQLPAVIDLGAVLIEALTLAVPLYPRAPGAEIGDSQFTESGIEPLRDEDMRPFSGLADLIRKDDGKN